MDFKSLLRKIDHLEDKSPISLECFFENMSISLSEWLLANLEGVLRERVSKAHALVPKVHRGQNVESFLAMLGKIPAAKVSAQSRTSDDEELISKIMSPLLFMFYYSHKYFEHTSPLISSYFYRAILFASEKTLTNDDEILSEEFLKFLEEKLIPRCEDATHVLLNIFIVLISRMPTSSLRKLLTPEICFRLRAITTRYPDGRCRLVDNVRRLYGEYMMENILEMRIPTWTPLLEVCQQLQRPDSPEAIKNLADIIENNSLSEQELIQSDLLLHIKNLLANSAQKENAIKTFLKCFLAYKSEDANQYSLKGCVFEKLINRLHETMRYLVILLEPEATDKSKTTFHGESKDTNWFENQLNATFTILQCLYELNNSWYQWFDIADAPAILDKNAFFSRHLSDDVYCDILKCGGLTLKLRWMTRLVKMCPAVVPFDLRVELFRRSPFCTTFFSFDCVITSRQKVLQEVQKLFISNNHNLRHNWDFRFDKEIGTGLGPTKEVYTLLSHELQRHDLNLWQGEPVTNSVNHGEKINYTYSTNGLFPKNSENVGETLSTFIFIGKLLAKALLEGHMLDIPLNEDFFRRLIPNLHPHLRKVHYDIPIIFPVTLQFFKQLILLKKTKGEILSDPSILSDKKQEVIGSLTFEDGSTFDDLYIDFTVPGTDIELKEGGYGTMLSPFNIEEYLNELCKKKTQLEPSRQFEALREGFNNVVPLDEASIFLPEELKSYLCGEQFEKWSIEYLQSVCEFEEGYSKESEPVRFLFEALTSLSNKDQRLFLQFVTSTPILPIGGLKCLEPPLKIKRIVSDHADTRLPSASTCFNLIHLPEYSSSDVTKERLMIALKEGISSFQFV